MNERRSRTWVSTALVGEVVERLQDQDLEHQHLVKRLAPGRGLARPGRLALAGLLEGRAQPVERKLYPGDQSVDPGQKRVRLGIEAVVAAAEVEEAGLVHRELGSLRSAKGIRFRDGRIGDF